MQRNTGCTQPALSSIHTHLARVAPWMTTLHKGSKELGHRLDITQAGTADKAWTEGALGCLTIGAQASTFPSSSRVASLWLATVQLVCSSPAPLTAGLC